MYSGWDDFDEPLARKRSIREADNNSKEGEINDEQETGCSWGQLEAADRPTAVAKYGQPGDEQDASEADSPNFIALYERYLADKRSIPQQTRNFRSYSKHPQKYIRDYFENEGHEEPQSKVEQAGEKRFVCSLELPVKEHDFTLISEPHDRKKEAIDEVYLDACRLLDSCHLLQFASTSSSHQHENSDDDDRVDLDRKRRINEANKEDDIEYDSTNKRHCEQPAAELHEVRSKSVNTYESLMAQWNAVNMSILQMKAKLVRLDLSVSKPAADTRTNVANQDEDELDPLDEFMSNLEKKSAPSMEDKIEKSRLKAQIAAQEREQSRLARMIELAKPTGVRH